MDKNRANQVDLEKIILSPEKRIFFIFTHIVQYYSCIISIEILLTVRVNVFLISNEYKTTIYTYNISNLVNGGKMVVKGFQLHPGLVDLCYRIVYSAM